MMSTCRTRWSMEQRRADNEVTHRLTVNLYCEPIECMAQKTDNATNHGPDRKFMM